MQDPQHQAPVSPKRKRSDSSAAKVSSPSRRKTEIPLAGGDTRTLVFRNLANGELKPALSQRSDDGAPTEPSKSPEPTFVRPSLSTSPPPSSCLFPNGPVSLDLWWKEAEITGHDPKDPTDDGYGINGIGFNPTPAMAIARVQHRRKQVAEWKNREARDARQKRIEMRRQRGDQESANTSTPEGEARKVRFLEPQG